MPEMADNMDSELLLKFIMYFSDYPLALSRKLLRFFFFWTTFVETAVYIFIITEYGFLYSCTLLLYFNNF